MREVFSGMEPGEINCESLNGVYREIADLLGPEAALTLHRFYRGQQVSFPVNLFTTDFIIRQMLEEYNGRNIKQLATKYGYSEKWTRKRINEQLGKKE